MLAALDPILLDIAAVFGVCVLVAVAFHRLRLPPAVGFLVAGAAMGPNAAALVQRPELVNYLAEVGVVVLLFTVGLELSLRQLGHLRRAILIAGGIQVAGTIGLGALSALGAGGGVGQAVFFGFLLALSSTAAVTKLLVDRGELATPPGRIAVAICVAQDLAVVPMILTVPLLAGGEDAASVGEVLQSFGLLAVIAVLAAYLVPRILDVVARTRSRELFVLTVITVCLLLSVMTAQLGVSLALGAFLAGLVIADSDHHHQAVAEVEPLRDALASLFFVSIGMLFDIRVVLESPMLVAFALAAVIGGKGLIAFVAIKALRMPTWVALRTALMLAQVGEFSFVLTQLAGAELLPERFAKVFFVVAVASIALTPLLFGIGKKLQQRAGQAERDERIRDPASGRELTVLVGYGPVGQSVGSACEELGIGYRVVEMNAATVKAAKTDGVPILLGDATRPAVLHAAGVDEARVVVIAVNDVTAACRVVAAVRRHNPHAHVIARANYLADVEPLFAAGCHEVVPQELESSVEITVRALRHYLISDQQVGRIVRTLRERAFGIDKIAPKAAADGVRVSEWVPGLDVQVFEVEAASEVVGKTLGELGFRHRTGLNVVALRRGDATTLAVGPDAELGIGDVLVALGPREARARAEWMFRGPEVQPPAREAADERDAPDTGEPRESTQGPSASS